MRTINVEVVNFETFEEANENKNYPNSGFFMAKVKEGMNDLRFVDKSVKHNHCIMPESVFNGVFGTAEIVKPLEAEQVISTDNKYDGDFILEFSRILLNRK